MLKIAWVLSYMKTGHTSTYVLQVFHCSRGVESFSDWAAFKKDFHAEFFPLDPAKTVALMLHDREQYGQGKHTLDEYIDLFQALVEQATYSNGLQLCLTFWDGLHPALVEHIDNLVEGHPDNEKIALCNLCHPAPTHPVLALTPATPAVCPLPPGIPMDVDVAKQLCAAPLLCWRYKKCRHFVQHCPLGLEVCYLSTAEQEELLLQLLATKDTTGALSLDEPIPELTPEEASMCTSPPEWEEDF
ncbi:hypothetical protein C0989_005246 [Termitomyces sp. Mn162]|nr:hypothetical protein C0989_005246 [Termitomyces sp. Mn162]